MEKTVQHKFLNSVVCTALVVPLGFFVLRDIIAVLTETAFEAIGGKESFLYQINDDIARLIIAGLLMLIMPIFFRGRCNFGFRGGKPALGICLALPQLLVPLWNLLQIKVYGAPLVAGGAAVAAAIIHGIGPGVSEEVFCRGFAVSNLMRIWKDKPDRSFRCMLVSGAAFGLLHALNAIATGDVLAALLQVIYTAAIGMLDGAVFLRSRSLWGVILLHSLTDISAFIAVFETEATGMDIIFCIVGSVLCIALALFLIRPAKRAEINELWADGWSFGEENGKKNAGARVAAILAAALVLIFAAAIGVLLYQGKMGYDVPIFSGTEKELDKEVRYQLSGDGKELTVSLPYVAGQKYELTNSDPASLVLKERRESGDAYVFVFVHQGTGTEQVKLTFDLKFADMPAAINGYSMTVSFREDGSISSVGG